MKLVLGDCQGVAAWVAQRIPGIEGKGFGPCAAIGLANDQNEAVAGFVFHDLQVWPDGATMQLSLASDSPRWLLQRKSIGRAVLSYPFHQQRIWKLWTAIKHDGGPAENNRTLKLGQSFGFTREALLVDQFGKGKHAFISRMTRKDYDKRYGVPNGQADTTSARSA